MSLFIELRKLCYKEFMLEFRNKTALSGLLLYAASTVYVSYLSFKSIIDIPTWNALFWIIILFAAFNGAARTFDKETFGRELYLYQLAKPESILLSKIIFTAALMLLLCLVSLVLYLVLLGTAVLANIDWPVFITALVLASTGFASILTLIAGIAYKTDNNLGLSAVLGIPVLIPFLLTLIKFSKNAIDGIAWSVNYKYFLVLLLLNAIVLVLAYVLFPYIWRD